MKATNKNLTLLVACLALPLAAFGQDDGAIDDIVVVGEKSASQLRKEVFETEEDFYALYNKYNDISEYDVRCFYETPTGTRIKNHVCRAKFVSDAYSKHAARNRNDVTRIANQDSNPEFARKTAEFQQQLETLINANPDLAEALIRYNTARAAFMEREQQAAAN